jgi:hypothetical protein
MYRERIHDEMPGGRMIEGMKRVLGVISRDEIKRIVADEFREIRSRENAKYSYSLIKNGLPRGNPFFISSLFTFLFTFISGCDTIFLRW